MGSFIINLIEKIALFQIKFRLAIYRIFFSNTKLKNLCFGKHFKNVFQNEEFDVSLYIKKSVS